MIARCNNSTCRAFIILEPNRPIGPRGWARWLTEERGWVMVDMDPLTFLCPRCAKEADHDR